MGGFHVNAEFKALFCDRIYRAAAVELGAEVRRPVRNAQQSGPGQARVKERGTVL